MRNPRALDLAVKAVAAAGSVGAVAKALSYDRSTLSRYLNEPEYPSPLKLEKAILAHFDRLTCPHTGADIDAENCRLRVTLPRPHGNPIADAYWASCQTCIHKEMQS